MKPYVSRLMVCLIIVSLVGLSVFGATANAASPRYYPETGHSLGDPFQGYWDLNGGLPVFGYPISEAFSERNADTGQTYNTQYFERNRMEYHPENAGTPYAILLGLLGKERLAQMGRNWQAEPREGGAKAGCLWFEQTGHNVCNQEGTLGFKTYWETHGLQIAGMSKFDRSLQLFGLPLTEPKMETNSSGDTVLTQWFERARFEWHPSKPNEYKVLLGLLSKDATAHRAGEPPFVYQTPMDEGHAAVKNQLFPYFNERRVADYGKPAVSYRDDVQQIADQAAQKYVDAKISGGDTGVALDYANERLAGLSGAPYAVYVTGGGLLEANCKNVDPNRPIISAYSPVTANMDFQTLTLGVSQIYQGSCGRSVAVVYIIGF